MLIAWIGKHFGEEPPLVGNENQGAGTIFFSGCNLRCKFCQNFQLSAQGLGKDYSPAELAAAMFELQNQGALNIDLASPTIWWQEIKDAINLAKILGLKIPIVWNSNAFEKVEWLRELDGLVDIYLPDYKYSDDNLGEKYSGIKNYSEVADAAIREMHRQVGNLEFDENGIATKGLIVRHLILPDNIENSNEVLKKISEIDTNICVSLMNQYFPTFEAKNYPELNRKLREDEFDSVFEKLDALGLSGFVQEVDSSEVFLPDFSKAKPFDL